MTTNNERTRGILRWINGEHLRIYGTQPEQESPQYSVEYPQQVDSTDCGIFVLTAADYVIKGFNLFKSCICDHNDIDQNDDSVILVNQISDMSDDESDIELENYGGNDEAREEASSMIV